MLESVFSVTKAIVYKQENKRNRNLHIKTTTTIKTRKQTRDPETQAQKEAEAGDLAVLQCFAGVVMGEKFDGLKVFKHKVTRVRTRLYIQIKAIMLLIYCLV